MVTRAKEESKRVAFNPGGRELAWKCCIETSHSSGQVVVEALWFHQKKWKEEAYVKGSNHPNGRFLHGVHVNGHIGSAHRCEVGRCGPKVIQLLAGNTGVQG